MKRAEPLTLAFEVSFLNDSKSAGVRFNPESDAMFVGASGSDWNAESGSGEMSGDPVQFGCIFLLTIPPLSGLTLMVSALQDCDVTLIVVVYSLSNALLSPIALKASVTILRVWVPA